MKFLGIDYGSKRIGLALSDDGGTLAFPKEIIPNDKKALDKVKEIILSEKAEEVVIGESLNFEGEPNAIMEEAKAFIKELLHELQIPVYLEKEFLTSVEARKSVNGKSEWNVARKVKEGISEKADASAAALILQRFLDRRNKK